MVGIDAASAYVIDEGFGGRPALATTLLARLPAASPNTPSPMQQRSDAEPRAPTSMLPLRLVNSTTPAKSEPGIPGSPGYISRTFRTSRKLSPTARTETHTESLGSAETVDAKPPPRLASGETRRFPRDPRGSGTMLNVAGIDTAEL